MQDWCRYKPKSIRLDGWFSPGRMNGLGDLQESKHRLKGIRNRPCRATMSMASPLYIIYGLQSSSGYWSVSALHTGLDCRVILLFNLL